MITHNYLIISLDHLS